MPLNICILSRSHSSKSRYKHYASSWLFPCAFTQVCVNRDKRSFIHSFTLITYNIKKIFILNFPKTDFLKRKFYDSLEDLFCQYYMHSYVCCRLLSPNTLYCVICIWMDKFSKHFTSTLLKSWGIRFRISRRSEWNVCLESKHLVINMMRFMLMNRNNIVFDQEISSPFIDVIQPNYYAFNAQFWWVTWTSNMHSVVRGVLFLSFMTIWGAARCSDQGA